MSARGWPRLWSVAVLAIGCSGEGDDTVAPQARPRVAIEAALAAGDDASLRRFLLHASAFELEAIVLTGDPSSVQPLLTDYGDMAAALRARDAAYPEPSVLFSRVVPATGATTAEATTRVAELLRTAGDRPLWYLAWSKATSSSILRQALDALQSQRPAEEYRRALGGLRVIGGADLGPHVDHLAMEVSTALPGTSGTEPLLAEQASFTFLYLLPEGPGAPHEPRWHSWAGRFQPHPGGAAARWVPAPDSVEVITSFTPAIQNELAWRTEHALPAGAAINAPPRIVVNVSGATEDRGWIAVSPGLTLVLDSGGSRDPDGHSLLRRWQVDGPASTASTPLVIEEPTAPAITIRVPERLPERQSLHVVLTVTDTGSPPLTRYRRLILTRQR